MKDWIMKDWIMELCPEIAEWQAEMIAVQMQIRIRVEREACVEVCDNLIRRGNVAEVQHRYNEAYEHCKDAIRARGEA